jgi:hypothetical protein
MTPYDVTPDDEPLDVRAVGEDDVLVEQLRHALSPDAAVVWDDDDELDPAFALLRALQLDVSSNLPVGETILPAGVTELLPRRRRLGRGATIAAVAAGVLSIGGVAAAAAPGQPLAGIRHAVTHAVSHAVDAFTPDAPVAPVVASPSDAGRPTAKPTPPGTATSTAARSSSAILQIEGNLDRAATLLDNGKLQAAKNQLAAAAGKLHYVTDAAAHDRLAGRLAALQARLTSAPSAKPSHGPADNNGNGGSQGNSGKAETGPATAHSPKPSPTKSEGSHASGHAAVEATTAPSPGVKSGDDGGHGGN